MRTSEKLTEVLHAWLEKHKQDRCWNVINQWTPEKTE